MIKEYLQNILLGGALLLSSGCADDSTANYQSSQQKPIPQQTTITPEKEETPRLEKIASTAKTQSSKPTNAYEQKLRSASKITIDEAAFSWGKSYNVKVDDEVVATVSGKGFTLFGDVFTLKTKDGVVLASEKEISKINKSC